MSSKEIDPDFQIKFRDLICSLKNNNSFGSFRILHGYWDKLTKIRLNGLWPLTKENREGADLLVATEGLISSGLAEELNSFLALEEDPHGFNLSISTIAQPKSAKFPVLESDSYTTLKQITNRELDSIGATLPKYLVETGQFYEFISSISDFDVLIVGPAFLTTCKIPIGKSQRFIQIPEWEASLIYNKIISDVESTLNSHPNIKCVIFSAGNIPAVVGWRLIASFPGVKWLDLGLSLSIFSPDGIANLPWFGENYSSVMATLDQFGLSRNINNVRNLEQLAFEQNLFQDLRKFLLNFDGGTESEIVKNYVIARDCLVDLPLLRLEFLNLLTNFPDSNESRFLHNTLEWEIENPISITFTSRLLLAKILRRVPKFRKAFINTCDELSLQCTNDYRSRLLKTKFYYDFGDLDLARESYEEELAKDFADFRQVKRMQRLLA